MEGEAMATRLGRDWITGVTLPHQWLCWKGWGTRQYAPKAERGVGCRGRWLRGHIVPIKDPHGTIPVMCKCGLILSKNLALKAHCVPIGKKSISVPSVPMPCQKSESKVKADHQKTQYRHEKRLASQADRVISKYRAFGMVCFH